MFTMNRLPVELPAPRAMLRSLARELAAGGEVNTGELIRTVAAVVVEDFEDMVAAEPQQLFGGPFTNIIRAN